MKKRSGLLTAALIMAIVACISFGCNNNKDKNHAGARKNGADSFHVVGTDFTGTVSTSVVFGSGTSCTGSGICNAPGRATNAVPVNFIQTNGNIQMWYNVSQNAPGVGTYTFTYPYDISADNQIFANATNWPYPSGTGAVIPAGIAFSVTVDAGNVSDTITFPANTIVLVKPQNIHVIFGGTTANCAYNPNALGIYSVSPSPIFSSVNPPTPGTQTVGITVGLKPGNASKLYFSFNIANLAGSGQTAQVANFVTGTAQNPGSAQPNYNFAANFPMFLYSAFNGMQLPAYAYILTSSASVLTLNGSTVTDTITYGIIVSSPPPPPKPTKN